jgi:hypothetical protein
MDSLKIKNYLLFDQQDILASSMKINVATLEWTTKIKSFVQL